MIYETLKFSPGGDRYIEVELGDGMSFELNFRVHNLTAAIREAKVAGVVELIPELAALQISYDPDVISYHSVVREVTGLYRAIQNVTGTELPSRLFYVPVLYFDPWTEECIQDYCAHITPKEADPDLICNANHLQDRAALKRLHSGTEYWVAALGFWPGLCSLMPLDDGARLVAPKYNPPRTWTPKGAIGLGGSLTCIYPDRTPGGYQLFARTPMPTFQREQRLAAFQNSIVLFRPGDRVRFVPIDRTEYDWIAQEVEAGVYQHPNVDYQTFSVERYRQWRDQKKSAVQPGAPS
jgi:KipI family sensor histidine kinase inhibitor